MRKMLQAWFVVGLILIAGVVTTVAEPMGMMASSSGGDKAFYERDLIWGTGIAMWGFVAVGLYKVGP